jgi:RimJ/RimL family protein N-acetyltransferase
MDCIMAILIDNHQDPTYQNEKKSIEFFDKNGHRVSVTEAGPQDFEAILHMYDIFEPKESAQGLPSRHPEQRRRWVAKMLRENMNVKAVRGGSVIGHACLVDIRPGYSAELEIGIHQDFQNRGIGTQLTNLLSVIARKNGYRHIWLTVEASNFRAIRVYEKAGFKFGGPWEIERDMVLELQT